MSMSKQQNIYGSSQQEVTNAEFDSLGQAEIDGAGTDELLDEIDALLDTNAEEFVRTFVQKGGQ